MTSRDVGFVLRFIIPLVVLGVLISFAETSRNAPSPNPSRWSLPVRIFESSKATLSNVPYFWNSFGESKNSLLFTGVAVGGTVLLGIALWIGMKELKLQSLAQNEMQQDETAGSLPEIQSRPFSPLSLRWKIPCAFAGMTGLLGLLVIVSVYRLTGQALRSQLDQQAIVIATNLSDGAVDYLMTQNFSDLNALTRKYARLDGVAYAFIEDGQGQVVAHGFEAFPAELRESLPADVRRQAARRTLTLTGRPVYEIGLPILEGKSGVTHVGIWEDSIEDEIYRTIMPIVGLVALVLFTGVIFSVFLARGIVQPIRQLTDIAGTISLGNLDTPINIDSRDEIGELASSLERMRASLKAAMVRLSRADRDS
jgi:HAMP domain-containing protein